MNEMRKLMEAINPLLESSEANVTERIRAICKARGLKRKKAGPNTIFLYDAKSDGDIGLEIHYDKKNDPHNFGWADAMIKKSGKMAYMGSGYDGIQDLEDVIKEYFDEDY